MNSVCWLARRRRSAGGDLAAACMDISWGIPRVFSESIVVSAWRVHINGKEVESPRALRLQVWRPLRIAGTRSTSSQSFYLAGENVVKIPRIEIGTLSVWEFNTTNSISQIHARSGDVLGWARIETPRSCFNRGRNGGIFRIRRKNFQISGKQPHWLCLNNDIIRSACRGTRRIGESHITRKDSSMVHLEIDGNFVAG